MVDRNLIREFYVDDEELNKTFQSSFEEDVESPEVDLDDLIMQTISETEEFDVNKIVEGAIVRVDGEDVVIDIGYKTEGVVHISEWKEEEDPPKAGDKVKVLLEEIEDDYGLLLVSKRKAEIIELWQKVIEEHEEGDIVQGEVVKKIKGGLLVNLGVNVFLPASQVDIRRPSDIGDFIGQTIECMILKIDEARNNIVVSRRKLIEEKRRKLREDLLSQIEEGQVRKGVVKNIADFGAFVDLGGIDGLLHITDMSYDRISHPTDKVSIDDEVEVMILSIDRENDKIALGIKQMFADPWENVQENYPAGTRAKGEVVNVMPYGAFVKLEGGVEGLVHISEMSWVKRINHPTDMVQIGDEVEVVVLSINMEKKEISLGMKQTQPNPWDTVSEKYPEGGIVDGNVRNLTNYGAFVELEEGVDGLLHVSDMSWTRKLSHANEMLKKGDQIKCMIISVDEERKRIALGLKQLDEDPWLNRIPDQYPPGAIVMGKVTKTTNFGAFVELEENLEGLLHISELADHKVENPQDIVQVGEEIEVRILRVDLDDRKIGLSRKLDVEAEVPAVGDDSAELTTTAGSDSASKELKGGIGGSGPLFSMPQQEEAKAATEEAEAEETEETEKTEEVPIENASPEEAEADSSEDSVYSSETNSQDESGTSAQDDSSVEADSQEKSEN